MAVVRIIFEGFTRTPSSISIIDNGMTSMLALGSQNALVVIFSYNEQGIVLLPGSLIFFR